MKFESLQQNDSTLEWHYLTMHVLPFLVQKVHYMCSKQKEGESLEDVGHMLDIDDI